MKHTNKLIVSLPKVCFEKKKKATTTTYNKYIVHTQYISDVFICYSAFLMNLKNKRKKQNETGSIISELDFKIV